MLRCVALRGLKLGHRTFLTDVPLGYLAGFGRARVIKIIIAFSALGVPPVRLVIWGPPGG